MPLRKSNPLYSVWQGMLNRCRNPKAKAWKDYGGRGITVCARWMEKRNGFLNFVNDMGYRPDGYSIERINNDLGYSPENCKWATKKEQQRNLRTTNRITVDGVEYVVAELAERYGFKPDTILARSRHGLSFQDLVDRDRRVFTNGLALGGKANGERQKAKTHCPYGHEYTPDNIVKNKDGFRRCKTCKREDAREKRMASPNF